MPTDYEVALVGVADVFSFKVGALELDFDGLCLKHAFPLVMWLLRARSLEINDPRMVAT
jgi:hypothetical protein